MERRLALDLGCRLKQFGGASPVESESWVPLRYFSGSSWPAFLPTALIHCPPGLAAGAICTPRALIPGRADLGLAVRALQGHVGEPCGGFL